MDNRENVRLVLASASPRRKELLSRMGWRFCVDPALGEEKKAVAEPEKLVLCLAGQKAEEVAARHDPGMWVIGADTVVSVDGEILGKPGDEACAARMLERLQGRSHSVFTGVSVYHNGQERISFAEETRVDMFPMTREEIAEYIKTGEPMDKAGAYGIQGKAAVYIKAIRGDYNNVVGLPLARLYQELRRAGAEK